MLLSQPLAVFYGYLQYLLYDHLTFFTVLVLASALPVIGVVRRRMWYLWYTSYSVVFLGLTAYFRPADFANRPGVVLSSIAAGIVGTAWLVRSSEHVKSLHRSAARSLMETRKSRRELSNLNAQLGERDRRMRQELHMAQKLQHSILPNTSTPELAGGRISVAARYSAMESIGGDFYDIAVLDDRRLGFLIADAAGHGVPAALVTTMAKVAFTTHCRLSLDPGRVLTAMNTDLCGFVGDQRHHLTAFYCVIDPGGGTLTYANGGHVPALLYQRATGEVRELDGPESFFLGVDADYEYRTGSSEFRRGDRLLMHTDGLEETRSPDGKLYGERRLLRFLAEYADLPGARFLDALLEDLTRYSHAAPQSDDIAILCVDCVGE